MRTKRSEGKRKEVEKEAQEKDERDVRIGGKTRRKEERKC